MKIAYYMAALLALTLTASCGKMKVEGHAHGHHEHEEEHTDAPELSEAQIKAVDIRMGKIEKKELSGVLRANGMLRLDPQNRADVTSLTGGIVSRILVREGQSVGKGQTVALIENTDIVEMQKNYLTAKKRLTFAEQEYERQKSLADKGAGVEKNLQQAKADYEISRAEVLGMSRQLAQLSLSARSVEQGEISSTVAVKAPIAGIVNRINVSTGSYADTQNALMSITDNSAVYCSLNVFETEISKVANNQEVNIRLTNDPSAHLTGKVYEINRAIDTETKTIPVHVKITQNDGAQLIPGMYVTATINMGAQKSEAVPDDAIATIEGRNYIFVLEGKEEEDGVMMYHFSKQEVITGASELGYTAVTFPHPLPENATVVTKNAFYIASMTADHGEH